MFDIWEFILQLFQYLMRLMYQNDKLTNRKRQVIFSAPLLFQLICISSFSTKVELWVESCALRQSFSSIITHYRYF